jgi:hypothetical protein
LLILIHKLIISIKYWHAICFSIMAGKCQINDDER